MAQKKVNRPRSTASKSRKKKKVRINYFPPGFWKQNWIPALVLFVISVLLYWMTPGFEYVLDDGIVVTENKFTQAGFKGIKDIFNNESFAGYFGEQKNLLVGARYRPLSIATFAIENQLWGFKSSLSHIINVLLYGLTVLIIFRCLALLFPRMDSKKWFWTVPFIAALIFAVHPLHTEVVANVKGRDEILSLLLSMTTFFLALRYYHKPKWSLLFGIVACYWLALLGKENAATFLGIIPLTLYFFRKWNWKKNLTIFGMLVIGFGIYFWMRYQAIGYISGPDPDSLSVMNNPFKGMEIGEKLATISYTLLLYLKLLIFPHPLTHDYYPYHIPIMNWTKLGSLFGLAAYLILAVIAMWGLRKKTVTAYCILFWLMSVSIVSNLVFPVGTFMNERFIYISSLAFCTLLAYFMVEKFSRDKSTAWTWPKIITGILVLAFSVKTIARIPAWRSGKTLNEAAIKVSKNSARANLFYGVKLFQEAATMENTPERLALLEDSEFYFKKAESILPSYSEATRMQGGAAAEKFKVHNDINQLLTDFANVLSKSPSDNYIYQYMQYLNDRGNHITELTTFYYRIGYDLMVSTLKRMDDGMRYIQLGLDINPNDPYINLAMGQSLSILNRDAEAAPFLEKAQGQ